MDWITNDIAIGNRIEAHDIDLRTRFGFRSVISLDGSMSDDMALALGYEDCVCFNLLDGHGNEPSTFRRVVRDLVDMVEGCPPVLVHCHAGRSRSVAVVAAYLVEVNGWTVQAAFEFVASKRETAVQDGLRDLVRRLRSH